MEKEEIFLKTMAVYQDSSRNVCICDKGTCEKTFEKEVLIILTIDGSIDRILYQLFGIVSIHSHMMK